VDCLYRWHVNKFYHTGSYNRHPENEPSGSKHVEDKVKIKLLFDLYYTKTFLTLAAFTWMKYSIRIFLQLIQGDFAFIKKFSLVPKLKQFV
jgi:hypothetical protein